jgi:GT2 family glycosyltransferase
MTYRVPTRKAPAPAPRNESGQRTAIVTRATDARGGREHSGATKQVGDPSLTILANPSPRLRFSIIVTSHNQREFIRDAVDSALSVHSAGTEIIVVDDASDDGSQEILRGYGESIRLASLDRHLGACAARNHGASMATGEFLIFLDGDDVLLPWALKVYERIVQTGKPKLILASMKWFRGALPAIHPADDPCEIQMAEHEDYLKKDRSFGSSASALVVERRSLLKVGGWTSGFLALQDQDLLIKLGDAGWTVQIVSPPTSLHRVHDGNMSKQVLRSTGQIYQILDREKAGTYPGGHRRRFERYALIGGMAFSWARTAMRSGFIWHALELLARSWLAIAAGVARKLIVVLKGRRACRTIAV